MHTVMVYDKNVADLKSLREFFVKQHWSLGWVVHTFQEWKDFWLHSVSKPQDLQIVILDLTEDWNGGIVRGNDILRLRPEAQIIFTSGTDTVMPELYEVPHIYHLRRPIRESDFRRALKKASESLERERSDMLYITIRKDVLPIKRRDILFLEKELRIIHIHCPEKTHSVYGKFCDIQCFLDGRFFRCHQSYIVNLRKVVEWTRTAFFVEGGHKVPISQAHRPEARRLYQSLILDRILWSSNHK